MTGTGTLNDPFVVANWDEFRSVDYTQPTYIKWQDTKNKVIDFNEIKPEGFEEKINLPQYIDFNGWTLKNFHANHKSYAFDSFKSGYGSYIKNLIFENFYLISISRLFNYINLENCMISGIFNSEENIDCADYGDIAQCSFNIKATTTKTFTLFRSSNNKVKNSDVALDILAKNVYIANNFNAYNCRFSGKIEASTGSVMLNGKLGNVYNLQTNSLLHYVGEGISVYNSDFSGATSSSTNLKACTSDELKSPEFLYNLGFPIGVE